MATIKDTIQIEGYDAMTADEKVAALEAMQLPTIDQTKYIEKTTFDKKTSELAEANRKIKALETANLTEEERKANERKAFEDEKAQFNRERNAYEIKSIFAQNGLKEADYADFDLESFDDRDKATRFANSVVKIVKNQRTEAEQGVRSSLLVGQKPPESGATATEAQALQQAYSDALKKNDAFAIAKAIRKAQEKGVSLQS